MATLWDRSSSIIMSICHTEGHRAYCGDHSLKTFASEFQAKGIPVELLFDSELFQVENSNYSKYVNDYFQ